MPLLKLESVSRDFDVSRPWLNRVLEREPRRLLRAVDRVSFEVTKGETLALVGESGCGKSTVARLIVGLHAPSEGRVEFRGRRMQMIFQDPYASLNPRWRVRKIIEEPMRVLETKKERRRAAAPGRPLARRRRALSARVLRRPAPAHLDRARARRRARPADLRRADLGARRLGAGADPQPDGRRCRSAWASPTSSSRTTWRWCRWWPIASASCTSAAWSSSRAQRELFARPRHPYTRMLLDAVPDLQMSGKRARRSPAKCPTRSPRRRLRLPPALPARQRALPRGGAEVPRPRGVPRRRGGTGSI